MKKIFRIILFLFIGLFFIGIAGSAYLVAKAYKELPDLENLIEGYTPIVPTKLYDSDGEVVDILYKEIREIATNDELPDLLKDAYVAVEDRKFYNHHGFYLYGMARAFVVNITTMSKAQGASTITQQLAKNAFLTNEKKIMRKVKEAVITVELERGYTKDEILEKYLNEIYFGSGVYGIKTAAKAFYRKSLDEVSLPEAALLAGIPNRPNKYNPRNNLSNAVSKSKIILKTMKRYDFINEEEYKSAVTHKFYSDKDMPEEYKELSKEELEELGVTIVFSTSQRKSYNLPDFTNLVEKKLFRLFDEKVIYEEGLEVYTTLDTGMQEAAKEIFSNYEVIKDKDGLDGGLVTIEADTGYVKAIVGGKNYRDGDYNRAIYAKRQPGSAFKPFVYFTALRLGYPMNTVVEDTPLKYGSWEPRNYSNTFRNNFTLLEGMERSINTVAIKTLDIVGLKNLNETVRLAGGEDLEVPQNLTAALGTMAVSPYELSTMYLPFANGGYRVKPEYITHIKNRYGKVIYHSQSKQEKVFEPEDTALITHMLMDVVEFGTGIRAKVSKGEEKIAQGGKTGTTNRQRTAWYAGITPKYVTTVYLGYDDNRPMDKGSTGGSLTAKLWGSYYQTLIDNGYDTGDSFRHIEDGLKNGTLSKVLIDSKNGRLADSTSGWSKRVALFKKGTEPVEQASIYNTGFDKLFMDLDEIVVKELEEKDEIEEEENNSKSFFENLFN